MSTVKVLGVLIAIPLVLGIGVLAYSVIVETTPPANQSSAEEVTMITAKLAKMESGDAAVLLDGHIRPIRVIRDKNGKKVIGLQFENGVQWAEDAEDLIKRLHVVQVVSHHDERAFSNIARRYFCQQVGISEYDETPLTAPAAKTKPS